MRPTVVSDRQKSAVYSVASHAVTYKIIKYAGVHDGALAPPDFVYHVQY